MSTPINGISGASASATYTPASSDFGQSSKKPVTSFQESLNSFGQDLSNNLISKKEENRNSVSSFFSQISDGIQKKQRSIADAIGDAVKTQNSNAMLEVAQEVKKLEINTSAITAVLKKTTAAAKDISSMA